MARYGADDKVIALETVKMWLNENNAAYLAKENIVTYWEQFSPDTKKGEYVKLKPSEACRIVKATRAGLDAMKLINPNLLMLAAQETERAYKQGVYSRSNVPAEYFNFCRSQHFNSHELLTLCMLQELVGRGMNVEAVELGRLMSAVFKKAGFKVPSRTFRWRLLRAVADEAGVVVRDRLNRLTVYKQGRFVCIQIEGIEDSIVTEFTDEQLSEIVQDTLIRFGLI